MKIPLIFLNFKLTKLIIRIMELIKYIYFLVL